MGSPAIPNTGLAIAFGKVYAAYATNSYPPAGGTNIRLSATLGPYETVPPDARRYPKLWKPHPARR